MPKLWTETIESHREAVREGTIAATAKLVAERGLASVTMSQIAEETGIGRATLYKYFPDVHAILAAWHEGVVGRHLEHLAAARDRGGSAAERLEAVLEAYASTFRHHGSSELAAHLHRGKHVARARDHVREFLHDLIAEAVEAGDLRADVAPAELATYCLHALGAASDLPSNAAVHRLVTVTLAGLRASR